MHGKRIIRIHFTERREENFLLIPVRVPAMGYKIFRNIRRSSLNGKRQELKRTSFCKIRACRWKRELLAKYRSPAPHCRLMQRANKLHTSYCTMWIHCSKKINNVSLSKSRSYKTPTCHFICLSIVFNAQDAYDFFRLIINYTISRTGNGWEHQVSV